MSILFVHYYEWFQGGLTLLDVPKIAYGAPIALLKSRDLVIFIAVGMTFTSILALIVILQKLLRLRLIESKVEFKHRVEMELSQGAIAQKMAAVTRIAAGAAHEINNPLNYVLSNLWSLQKYMHSIFQLQDLYQTLIDEINLAEHENLKPTINKINALYDEKKFDFMRGDIHDLLVETNEGLDRIKEIVANLRFFSTPENEVRKSIDINQVIEASLKIVSNKIPPGCVVYKHLTPLPLIIASKNQLTIIFSNLLMNAIQSILTKGTITISTVATSSHILIEIRDTGYGIAPENLSKIFTPFFTTHPVGMGAGLGLSTAFAIVQLYNGNITVNSDVGNGTIFSVLLPIEKVSQV
jgi:two-component system NtrC family sensor kinase